ncbi:glycoside hydrolase family 16 protein [Pseudoflavitalea sp. G-6-1-2]|uniref:glycoside hydrolase family 16 protein n=1 Tax=Pseudoflavitalea sp. G-6-1-2 TaxID=2728841 RepID=UPI00146EB7F6|nr:glycoside hydrolase family 16 protein [Pseudoflavitalea sp. G-6-1-2]NML23374.1 glycoside hydrolase family 16 protein [Pseudoflavitalea sp. G-6-1-2]
MKPRSFLLHCCIAASLILPSFAHAQQVPVVPAPAWSDEFNYTGLPDSTKWSYDVGGSGWGNEELQFYTKGRKENVWVENGRLVIEARKEDWEGNKYTSTRLVSKGKGEWQYGRIEVRAKLPAGRGSWPAIWMLNANPKQWPDDGEIDIMEHVGHNPGMIHGSAHTKKYFHTIGTQKTDTIRVNDVSEKFHVYALDWNADSIRVSVDNNTYFTFRNEHTGNDAWPFDNKFYLLLNIAVGGFWGGQKGVDDTIFPIRMEIDYVRVYK